MTTAAKQSENLGGAPAGNSNAMQHGMRSSRYGLTSGGLPKGCSFIRKSANTFRAALEAATIECKGEINLHDAMQIQTSIAWLMHAEKARRWLKLHFDELTFDQKLSFSRETARALAERDKAVKALNLDTDNASDIWQTIHEPIASPALAQPSTEASQIDTPQGKPQQRTESQLGASPTSSPGEGQEGEALSTRFMDAANGFPVVSSSGDSECPRDRDIEFQRSEGPSDA